MDGTTTALSDAFDSNVIQPGLSIFSDALAGFNQGNGARQFDNDRAFSVNSGLALAQFSEQTSNVFFDNTSQFLGDVLTRSHEQRQEDIALNGFRAERFRIGNAAAAADFAAIGDTNFIDFQSDAVRFNIASGIAQRDAQELTSIALGVASLPLLALGGGALGSLALRGVQVGIRGVQAGTRAVTSFADDFVNLGLRNAVGLRVPTASIHAAEALAGFSEGGIYTASFGTVAIGTGVTVTRFGDEIIDAVGFGNRTLASPSEIARRFQGNQRFPGTDTFRNVTVKKGTILVAGEPGFSGFFTTERGFRRSGGDAAKLFGGLQVPPRQNPITDAFEFRPRVRRFIVEQDVQAAFGIVRNNPQHGLGGLPQVVISNFNDVVRPLESVPLTNINP